MFIIYQNLFVEKQWYMYYKKNICSLNWKLVKIAKSRLTSANCHHYLSVFLEVHYCNSSITLRIFSLSLSLIIPILMFHKYCGLI